MKTDVDLIKKKVADADLNEALTILSNGVDNSEYSDAVILLQGRFNRLLKSNKLGVIEGNDFDAEINKISLSILDILKMLKSDFISKEMKIDPILHFFESPFDKYPEYNERVYNLSFENDKTRSVGWELRCQFPALQFSLSIGAKWRVYKSDNTYTVEFNGDFIIPEKWSSFWVQRTYGYFEVGKWIKGNYTIELYIDNNLVGKGTFTIA